MAMLEIVVPKIDEWEEAILADKQKLLRLERIQQVYTPTVPDVVKASFAGSGLAYWYETRRDCIFLRTRLPENQSATFRIRFKNLSAGLRGAIAISRDLCATIARHGKVSVEKYDRRVLWTETDATP